MRKKLTKTVLILCFSQVLDVFGSFLSELDALCLQGQYEAGLAFSRVSRPRRPLRWRERRPRRCSWGSAEGSVQHQWGGPDGRCGGATVAGRGAEEGRWEVGAKVVGRRSEDVFYISYVFSIPCNINLFWLLVIVSPYFMFIIFSSKLMWLRNLFEILLQTIKDMTRLDDMRGTSRFSSLRKRQER